MFSIMTMASSTTKPTEIVSAMSEKLSSEKPSCHIPASVPAIERGTVAAAASSGTRRRMNTITTSSTSATEISSAVCTSSTLARIVAVRSETIDTLMSGGIQASRRGSSALMRSAVWMPFAPATLLT